MVKAFLVLLLKRNNPKLGSEIEGRTVFIQVIL